MNRALSEYIITGITTNLPFHKSVMRNKAFKNGDLSTSFIKDNNILLNVPDIIKEDKERETRLLETFKEDKKVVAISAAVNSYIRYNVDKQQL
jgi:pyruvate carboxylase subunit A